MNDEDCAVTRSSLDFDPNTSRVSDVFTPAIDERVRLTVNEHVPETRHCECPIHVVGGAVRRSALYGILGGVLTAIIARGIAAWTGRSTELPNEWLVLLLSLAGLLGAISGFVLGMTRLNSFFRVNDSSLLVAVLVVAGLLVGVIVADRSLGHYLAVTGLLTGVALAVIGRCHFPAKILSSRILTGRRQS